MMVAELCLYWTICSLSLVLAHLKRSMCQGCAVERYVSCSFTRLYSYFEVFNWCPQSLQFLCFDGGMLKIFNERIDF